MKSSGRTLPRPTAPKPRPPKPPGGAVAGSSRRLARQRRPGWIVAGAGLLAFAMLGNVYMFRSSDERVPVVQLKRDVPVGQQIVQADLDVARVATDSALATVPVRQLPEVVGRRASVGLRKGTLLAASQLSANRSPQKGRALVTAPLKASAMPPGLAPGWQVRVVFTPGGQDPASQNTGGQVAGGPGQSSAQTTVLRDIAAVVDQVEGPDAEGAMTVSLLVAESDSSTVARQAAAGLIVLVVTERRG